MSLLRTKLLLAVGEPSRNRRISAGFIVEAAAGASALCIKPRALVSHALSRLLTTSSTFRCQLLHLPVCSLLTNAQSYQLNGIGPNVPLDPRLIFAAGDVSRPAFGGAFAHRGPRRTRRRHPCPTPHPQPARGPPAG